MTHRFVFLAAHVAHCGDRELSEAERSALTDAAHRLGLAARHPRDATQQMVYDAIEWYYDLDLVHATEAEADKCVERVAATFAGNRDTLTALWRQLRKVATADGTIHPQEAAFLDAVAAAWHVQENASV